MKRSTFCLVATTLAMTCSAGLIPRSAASGGGQAQFTSDDPNCVALPLISQTDVAVPGQEGETATVYKYEDSGGSSIEQARPDNPASVDPLQAADVTLAFYGFPPRPNDEAALKNWIDTVSNFKFFEPPGICVDSTIGNVGYRKRWSGIEDNSSTSFFNDVTGNVHVPNLDGTCSGSAVSLWVGIGGDGPNSSDKGELLQNGIVATPGNGFDWFWEALSNTTTDPGAYLVAGSQSPGDKMYFETYYHDTFGPDTANFYWINSAGGQNSVTGLTTIRGAPVADYRNPEAILERVTDLKNNTLWPLKSWSSGDAHFTNVYTSDSGSTQQIKSRPHINLSITSDGTSSGRLLADFIDDTGDGEFFVHHSNCS